MKAPPMNPANETPVSRRRILVVPTAARVRRMTLPVSGSNDDQSSVSREGDTPVGDESWDAAKKEPVV